MYSHFRFLHSKYYKQIHVYAHQIIHRCDFAVYAQKQETNLNVKAFKSSLIFRTTPNMNHKHKSGNMFSRNLYSSSDVPTNLLNMQAIAESNLNYKLRKNC